jgi:hypothetical protein
MSADPTQAPESRQLSFPGGFPGESAQERGWSNLRLLSSAGNKYNRDYLAEDDDGAQRPILNVFVREGARCGTSGPPSFCTRPGTPISSPATSIRSGHSGTSSR